MDNPASESQDAAAAGVLLLLPDDEPAEDEFEDAEVVELLSDFFDSVLVEPGSFEDDDAAAGSEDDFSELVEPARLSVR